MTTAPRQKRAHAAAIVAAAGASAALARAGRARLLRWGATDAEISDSQPGDDLIVNADVTATRAITIRRSPDAVWPWIAQLGQGRGGFYSYDRLENLLGFDIHSAARVVPDWQKPEVGDEVRLAPTVGLTAVIVEPGRALVLQEACRLRGGPRSRPPGHSSSPSNPTVRRDSFRASATATSAGGLGLLSSRPKPRAS